MAALAEETIALGGTTLSLLRPPDPEALISEEAFEREEFLPYWAELWPSGLALAEEVEARGPAGARVLELGCGLGLPSLAAALGGADVLATDWSPDAVALLRRNAARNGISLAVEDVSWFDPGPLAARAPWDLVLAADVLYERRNVSPLLALLPRLGPEILVAEPGRPAAAEFLERAARGWTVETSVLRESPAVRLYRLT
jgi:predicted nicotinamide N-methyase